MVATCTGGERGDILNAAMNDDPHGRRDLPGLRRLEMARAAAELGVRHRWLGFEDSGLPEGDPLQMRLVAGGLAQQAGRLGEVSHGVDAALGGLVFEGPAADRLRAEVVAVPERATVSTATMFAKLLSVATSKR